MWPILLDMSKLECKKALRILELEAYAMIVSAFRAQGELTQKKIEILKELQLLFKISIDRHKAELRRATNDEKLYTIAKLLSHGDCVSTEWIKQSKRLIPLLPSLQSTNSSSSYYRILADQILSKAEPVLNLFPEQRENSTEEKQNSKKSIKNKKSNSNNKIEKDDKDGSNSESEMNELDSKLRPIDDDDKNLLYLKNGYAVDSKCVSIENTKPSEYIDKYESINETDDSNSKSFLKFLIQKYKQQQSEALKQQKQEDKKQKEIQKIKSSILINNQKQAKLKSQESVENTIKTLLSSISTESLEPTIKKTNSSHENNLTTNEFTVNDKEKILLNGTSPITTITSLTPLTTLPTSLQAAIPQALIPIQLPIQTSNLKIASNQLNIPIKLNNSTTPLATSNTMSSSINNSHITSQTNTAMPTTLKISNSNTQLNSKLLIPKSSQKLIILPTNTNAPISSPVTNANNLKILTVQPSSINPKILLNVPNLKTSLSSSNQMNTGFKQLNGFTNSTSCSFSLNETNDNSILKRKICDLSKESNINALINNTKKNSNLVCFKLDKLEEDVNKNGFYENDDLVKSNKRIKLVDNINLENSANSTNSD